MPCWWANSTRGVTALLEVAKDQLRAHFRRRAAERATELVEQWKREDIYPYVGEPKTSIEATERQVFEVVAVNVNSYLPEFATADKKSKQFSFRLLRQAIEDNPDSMQRILSDVLDLPKYRQDELAELLQQTSLASIIAASKLVADRLNFLRALEVMLFEAEPRSNCLSAGSSTASWRITLGFSVRSITSRSTTSLSNQYYRSTFSS